MLGCAWFEQKEYLWSFIGYRRPGLHTPSPNGDGTKGFHYKTKINTNKLASLQQQLRGRGPKPRLLGHHVLAAGQGLTLGVSLPVGTHTAEQQAMALEHGFHDLFFPSEP